MPIHCASDTILVAFAGSDHAAQSPVTDKLIGQERNQVLKRNTADLLTAKAVAFPA
jgi:hypothetical protein